MPVGRPPTTTDHLPDNWKDIVLEMSANGASDVEIRANIALGMKTVNDKQKKFSHEVWYALKKRDEEFAETIQIGKTLCQAWWERISRENLYHNNSNTFETGSWYANMKNRFGWCDNKDVSLKVEDAQEYFKTIANAIAKSDTNTS